MQYNQLRYAVKISETHSFSQAAKELFITQPSLSQQIIKLEKELGVRLFERNGNTVILTKAGENFIKDAKQAILSFEQIKSDMECFRYAGKEHLRIGLMRSVQYRYMIHDISVLQSQFPKIALSLSYQDSVELRQMLLSGELDGAFLLPGHTEGIAGFERWDLPYRIYALISPENPLNQRSTLGLRDLSGQRLLLTGTDKQAFSTVVHLISQVDMQVELYLPQEGEDPMDDRSVAFVLEGGHVPEQYRNCEIVPMALFDLYGISFLVHRQYQENDLIQAMVRHFTGKD